MGLSIYIEGWIKGLLWTGWTPLTNIASSLSCQGLQKRGQTDVDVVMVVDSQSSDQRRKYSYW